MLYDNNKEKESNKFPSCIFGAEFRALLTIFQFWSKLSKEEVSIGLVHEPDEDGVGHNVDTSQGLQSTNPVAWAVGYNGHRATNVLEVFCLVIHFELVGTIREEISKRHCLSEDNHETVLMHKLSVLLKLTYLPREKGIVSDSLELSLESCWFIISHVRVPLQWIFLELHGI